MIDDEELYEAFKMLMVNPDGIEEFAENKIKESDKYKDMSKPEQRKLRSQIEMEADDRLDEYDDGFKPEFLRNFLLGDSDFFKDEQLLSNYQLKGKQLGELTNLLVEDINNKYKGFKEIPKTTRDLMVKKLLKLSEVKGGVRSKDLELSLIHI